MRRRFGIWITFFAAMLMNDATAHHTHTALFDLNDRFTLKATLTKVDWRNPHIELVVEVKSSKDIVRSPEDTVKSAKGAVKSAEGTVKSAESKVKSAEGKMESVEALTGTWQIRGPSPSFFRLRNVGKADFEKVIGETVTVELSRARDKSRSGLIRTFIFPNGEIVSACPQNC